LPLPTTQQLESKTHDLKLAIAHLGELFPGSLVESFRKCGKATCHCAKKGDPGHGPNWIVTREVKGHTMTKTVPAEALDQIRAGTEEYKKFRELSRELVDASGQLGEIRLKEATGEQPIKKNRARRRFRRRTTSGTAHLD
jgi:hypothetical protein